MKIERENIDNIITLKESDSEFKRDYWRRKNVNISIDKMPK